MDRIPYLLFTFSLFLAACGSPASAPTAVSDPTPTSLPTPATESGSYPCDAAITGAWRCLYVATDGDDANIGSLDSPFATLDRARAEARAFGAEWLGDVVISIRGGAYYLDETLTFEPADSGKNGYRLIFQPYRDETVTIAGGRPVGNWAGPLEGGLYYTTDIPAGVELRHLVVNGRRAQRAQHPNAPEFQTIAAWDPSQFEYGQPCSDNPGRRLGVKDEDAWFVDSLHPAELSRVEVFVERVAGSAILRLDSVGQANEGGSGIRYLVPKDPERSRLFARTGCEWQVDGLALRFENSLAFLDAEGEWFLDTITTPGYSILYYKPHTGEDPNASIIIAPHLETLVKFAGAETNRVQNITLRGLKFTATTWFLPNTEGFVSLYPGNDYREINHWDTHLHPAAIHLEGTERVTIERNVLHALGGMGIALYDYTNDTVVNGNALLEVAGIGIAVDGEGYVSRWPEDGTDLWAPPAGQPRSSGDRITNNRIQRFGLDYWSSAGIAAAYPWEMTVAHNEISDGFSHGIVLGWYGKWTRCHEFEPFGPPSNPCQTAAGKNRIVGNRIFAVGGINNDVGGIYTLGHQSSTDTFEDGLEIRGNHVFNMTRVAPAALPTLYVYINSLYLDGDTSFTKVVDNIFETPPAVPRFWSEQFNAFFLNPDTRGSIPPHDIHWDDNGLTVPLEQVLGASQVGDNVSDPNLKPHVRDAAGLSPGYEDVPRLPAASATPRPDDGILLGAIRWDGWYGGSHYVRILFPEEWRYRLPFYASVLPDGQVEMASDSQAVMDQEIAYAAANGIDYWIFLMYILRDEQGNPLGEEQVGWKAAEMNLSRQYYLSSPYKHTVNFALMLQVQGYVDADGVGHNFGEHNWNFQVEEAVTQMQEPSYQTVLDGRPLVYFFLWGEDVGKIWGSWDAMREKLDGFRQRAQDTGLKNPYIVAMVSSAEEGKRAVAELGVDAVTSYVGVISGGYDNTADYTYYGYDTLAQADRDLWESFRAADLKTVPVASMGWDPRPHRDDIWGYGGYKYGPVVERATPEQLATHVLEAVKWMWTYPDAAEPQTVIIYAWNELAEGGWLVPTLEEGDARLRAIGEALRYP